MSSYDISLGDWVEDVITGFKGVVVGRAEYLHKNDELQIQAPGLKDSLPADPQWLAAGRVEPCAAEPSRAGFANGGATDAP